VAERISETYFKVKKFVNPEQKIHKNLQINKIKIEKKSTIDKKTLKKNKLSDEEKQNLVEIIKRAKLNATKGYFDTAKILIVE